MGTLFTISLLRTVEIRIVDIGYIHHLSGESAYALSQGRRNGQSE